MTSCGAEQSTDAVTLRENTTMFFFDHRRPNTFTNSARSWSSDGCTFPRKKQRHKMWGLSTYLPPQSCCAVAPLQKRRQHGLWKHTATLHVHPQPSQVLVRLKTNSHSVHTHLWPSLCSQPYVWKHTDTLSSYTHNHCQSPYLWKHTDTLSSYTHNHCQSPYLWKHTHTLSSYTHNHCQSPYLWKHTHTLSSYTHNHCQSPHV